MRARSFRLLAASAFALLWTAMATMATFAGEGIPPIPK
jgi:hypothetical protein